MSKNLILSTPSSGMGFSVPAIDYAGQGNAVLGIRDAGKTYTAMKAAEQLLDAGIPIIVYDPVGVWKNLKIGVGKHPGYPIVVAGGQGSDIILTPANAVDIVRAAMKAGISLVIDLYSRELINKSTWIKIVQETVDELMYENEPYGMRHIFLEEAAEFIPQKIQPQHSRVYASLERLARMGRNARLGYTLINQRAEEVNKAILEISALMLLHKQVGKNSINSIKKWLELLQVENIDQVIKTLSQLKSGECWIIGHGMCKKIQVGKKNTFHPDPKRKANQDEILDSRKIDVTSFVNRLNSQLNKAKPEPIVKDKKREITGKIDDAENNRLRTQVNDLLQKNDQQAQLIKQQNGQIIELKKALTQHGAFADQIQRSIDGIRAVEVKMVTINTVSPPSLISKPLSAAPRPDKGYSSDKTGSVQKRTSNYELKTSSTLPPGEKAILTACAQFPNGLRRDQLTVLTGYKRSSRDTYIQRMNAKGLLIQQADRIFPTEQGINELGSEFEPLPTGGGLRDYWLAKLPAGEAKILECLIDQYPNDVERDHLTSKTGYMRSSRDTYIQRMNAKEVIIITAPGRVKASDTLFD